MTRKTINILISILAIIYTLFTIAHLVAAIRSECGGDRWAYILSAGTGALCGVYLVIVIFRSRKKDKSHHKKHHCQKQ